MQLFGINFNSNEQISNFIQQNNNKEFQNQIAYLKVNKHKLNVKLYKSGQEFRFNRYGHPIFQDIFIYLGKDANGDLVRINHNFYDFIKELNEQKLNELNNFGLMRIAKNFNYLVENERPDLLSHGKKTIVQRRKFDSVELITRNSYAMISNSDMYSQCVNGVLINVTGHEFDEFRGKHQYVDYKDKTESYKYYSNIARKISDNNILLKIKIYQTGLGNL